MDILQPDVLLALADNSGPLLDYFVMPGSAKKIGQEWKVRARDVGSLLPVGKDASLFGSITLRREKDIDADRTRLNVVKAEIKVVGRGERRDEQVDVRIKNGYILYSLVDLFVQGSRLELAAQSLYRSKDHLLFRAERLRDLEIMAVYSAEVVNKGTK